MSTEQEAAPALQHGLEFIGRGPRGFDQPEPPLGASHMLTAGLEQAQTLATVAGALDARDHLGLLLAGSTQGGAQRWIALGGFSLQPSEFVKIPTVLMLAKYFGSRQNGPLTLKQTLIGGAIFAGPVLVGAWFTLRERAMLGDSGASLIGGTLHLAQAQSNRGASGRKKDFPDAERLVKRLVAQELTHLQTLKK